VPRSLVPPEFFIDRDPKRCIKCGVCVRQCGFTVHYQPEPEGEVLAREENCVGCQRCVAFCPTRTLTIRENVHSVRSHPNWTAGIIHDIQKQAETGGIILGGMGCDKPYPIYFDHLLLNASQVTNPAIDPLREPMEVRTYLGSKAQRVEVKPNRGSFRLEKAMPVGVKLETPIMFAAMSFGSISKNVCESLARAASELGILFNTGEGGYLKDLRKYANNSIVQVASGRFGVDKQYLDVARVVEIKMGQGAKPGIGGHLPGEKMTSEVARTRMIPQGTDAISPAPHHDIYSIEDLKQLIDTLKEVTDYKKPISVKVAAVHNVAAIASGIARAGADIITVDGMKGGTGAAPKVVRNEIGIPIEIAIASVDQRLREEGIRDQVSLVASGGIRCSADVLKAICLGADAVYIGTSALVALGCHLCGKCYTGKCSWGIATQDEYLTRRVNPQLGAKKLVNLVTAWTREIKEVIGAMGINAIESLRGNRLHLRGIGLNEVELRSLGVKAAGESM
jgi:glutamate synthase domain-containing protein 2